MAVVNRPGAVIAVNGSFMTNPTLATANRSRTVYGARDRLPNPDKIFRTCPEANSLQILTDTCLTVGNPLPGRACHSNGVHGGITTKGMTSRRMPGCSTYPGQADGCCRLPRLSGSIPCTGAGIHPTRVLRGFRTCHRTRQFSQACDRYVWVSRIRRGVHISDIRRQFRTL